MCLRWQRSLGRRAIAIVIATFAFAHEPGVRAADYPGAIADLRVARGAGTIAEAWLADSTTRYRHFVLGSRYEAASLMVRLRDGKLLRLTLPEDSVFEDRQPRLADLDGDGVDEIVLVRSYLRRGARPSEAGFKYFIPCFDVKIILTESLFVNFDSTLFFI